MTTARSRRIPRARMHCAAIFAATFALTLTPLLTQSGVARAEHAVPPHAPEITRLYSAQSGGSGSLGIEWAQPEAGSGGAAAYYRIRIQAENYDGTACRPPSGAHSCWLQGGAITKTVDVQHEGGMFRVGASPRRLRTEGNHLTHDVYAVQVRAYNAADAAGAWGTVAKIPRDSPPPPVLLETRVQGGRIHLRWAAGTMPAWVSHAAVANAKSPSGYSIRFLRFTARDDPQNPVNAWPTSPVGDANKPAAAGFHNRSATDTFAFTIEPGVVYGVQIAANHGNHRRGWWGEVAEVYTDRLTLYFSTDEYQNAANRATHTLRPAFSDAVKTYEIGPVSRAQNQLNFVFNDDRKGRAKFVNDNRESSEDRYSVDYVVRLYEDRVETVTFAIGDNTPQNTNTLFVHRLAAGDKPPTLQNVTLAGGEYTDAEGVPQPQLTLKWTPWKFADYYQISCKEETGDEASETYDSCAEVSAQQIAPAPPDANGLNMQTLRPANLDFGDEYAVTILPHWTDAQGVQKTSATAGESSVTLRAKSADATLSHLAFAEKTQATPLPLEPAFSAQQKQYTLYLAHGVEFTATAHPAHRGAQVTQDDLQAANPGVNPVTFRVTAEDGETTADYVVNVVRYPQICCLKFTTAGGVEIAPTPAFSVATSSYAFHLPVSAASGVVEYKHANALAGGVHFTAATPGALTATDTQAGAEDTRVRHTLQIPLGGARHLLTATAGGFTATYALTTARAYAPSADATLHSLQLQNAADARAVAFSPRFSPRTFAYHLSHNAAALHVIFRAHRFAQTTNLAQAAHHERGDTQFFLWELSPGVNRTAVLVTAENGFDNAYELLATRPPGAATLPDVTAITLSRGATTYALTPAFSKTTFSYALALPDTVTPSSVTVAATAADGVDLGINGAHSPPYDELLYPGENYISVHAEAGAARSAYVVRVTLPAAAVSDDARLYTLFARERTAEIAFTQHGQGAASGDAARVFHPLHRTYTAEVLRSARRIVFTPTAHPRAQIKIDGVRVGNAESYAATLQNAGANTITIEIAAEDGSTFESYAFTFTRNSANSAPQPPAQVTLESPAEKTLRAVWTPPVADGGDAVRTYYVRWGEVDGGIRWKNAAGARGENIAPAPAGGAHTYALGGAFSPGVTYELQVAAANTIGIGDWEPARAAARGFTLRPPQLELLGGDARLTAKWTAPESGATTIAEYRLRHRIRGVETWSPDSGGRAVTALAGAHSARISALQNAAEYAVQIAAVNENGRGPWSASERATPLPQVLPAPRDLAARGGDRSIRLTWNRPVNNSGSPIREFRVRWARAVSQSARAWNAPEGEPAPPQTDGNGAYVIRGVLPGTSYEVQIAARNENGRGNWASLFAAPRAFSLDANEDGKITAADGIIIARYLMGVRGESLTAGQARNLTPQRRADIAANLASGVASRLLNVDGGNSAPVSEDGFYIARYLMGLRGDNLSAPAKRAVITGSMRALMLP